MISETPILSRRDVIKVAAWGALVGGLIGKWLAATFDDEVIEQIARLKLTEKSRDQLDAVIAYRKNLGLSGLPNELIPALLETVDWNQEPEKFQHEVPTKNLSFSLLIDSILQSAFGINATRNIRGARSDPNYPYGMSFSGSSRYCNVSEEIHAIPFELFPDFILHEACGHGTDPAVGAKYPIEVMIQVELGKWEALSQAFSVPEQFLNHPQDLTLPMVYRELGAIVGKHLVGEDKEAISGYFDGLTIEGIALEAMKEEQIQGYLFTKAACKKIGHKLVDLLRIGQIEFKGKLKNTYEQKLSDACMEIYAEMFKYAVLYRDKLNNNPLIVDGISKVLLAHDASKTLEGLEFAIRNPSQDVVQRYLAEKAYSENSSSTTQNEQHILTAEEIATLKQEQEAFEERERKFLEFCTFGVAPDGFPEPIQKFAAVFSRVVSKYPMLKDTFSQQYNESFDPQLHIWVTHQIEDAANTSFIRGLLDSQVFSEEVLFQIKYKTDVLEWFENSGAF